MNMAVEQPVLFIVEDIHWADPSTIEFLNFLMDGIDKARMLVLLTSRPENPNILGSKYADFIMIDRLNDRETAEMTEIVARETTLPSELLRQIVSKSDGIPLYVEEITKMVIEQDLGTYGRVSLQKIPSTLQDSLMARLDRLSTVKEVAQLGATIGREFSYELIRAISAQDETTLQRELNRLVEAEILYSHWAGLPPQNRYLFKHALIKDAAYQSLLKSKRQQYHRRIAEVLEERFHESTEPEIIAHHYTGAGLGEKAIRYWTRAGHKATERSANKEAISHLKRALQLLETLPETPDRNEKGLTLLVMLGSALALSKGFSNPEVEETYDRALGLCGKVGDTPHLFPILLGLSIFYSFKDFNIAGEMTDKMFKIAESSKDPSFFIWCHSHTALFKYWQGELDSSLEHLNAAIAISETEKSYNKFGFYDPILIALCYKSWVLFGLGYPDKSYGTILLVQAKAQGNAHPLDLSVSMCFTAMMHCFRRDSELAFEMSEAMIKHSTEFGIPFYIGLGKLIRSWALIMGSPDNISVRTEDIIEQMWQGIETSQIGRDELVTQMFAPQLAQAYLKTGQIDAGLNFVNECLANLAKTGFLIFEHELNRFKGKFLLALHDDSGPEECFLRAIEIARKQKAKSFELRAVMELSRLWMKQGKREEARKMLVEIYGWFTEGFNTRDLIEPKELLDELL
jgi:predicted ATPase